MRFRLAVCWWPLYWQKRVEWDRLDIWFGWLFRLELDRAWLDDRQWNPCNWMAVRVWKRRHPIWMNRVGLRIDRLMIDWKLGVFWCSRTRGERGRDLYLTKRCRRARQEWWGQ